MDLPLLPTPLVTVDWLAEYGGHPQVTIADCRFSLGDPLLGNQQYFQGHIPGAVRADLRRHLSGPLQVHGGRHPLPNWQQFCHTLEGWGISSDPATRVVVYDDSRGPFAARLWWMLRYLGHPQVAVLQGGIRAWTAAGHGLSQDIPQPRRGQFQPQFQAGWLLDREQVLAARSQGELTLVDARAPERYRGEVEPIDPIAGSIPGAENLFWQTLVDEAGYFYPAEVLRDRWQTLEATLPPGASLGMYCGSGVTACVNLLAREVAGYPMVPLYAGGWSDWCSYAV